MRVRRVRISVMNNLRYYCGTFPPIMITVVGLLLAFLIAASAILVSGSTLRGSPWFALSGIAGIATRGTLGRAAGPVAPLSFVRRSPILSRISRIGSKS